MGRRNLIPILLTICLGAPLAFAQSKDPKFQKTRGDFHLREDQARELYSASAFAHGHRHGYEEGFRTADLEIHVGRQQRELRQKDIPKSDYQKEFGDKEYFQQGFAHGFKAGYKDSYSNRSFRLVEWSAQIPPFPGMTELPQADPRIVPDARMRVQFENGTAQGYASGSKAEVAAADAKSIAGQATRSCGELAADRPEGFCEGFTQGFLLGVNHHAPAPLAAPVSGLAQNRSHPQPQ
ncbi:MAG: hypothetical protein ABIP81_02275 [Terriglobales bacterium]